MRNRQFIDAAFKKLLAKAQSPLWKPMAFTAALGTWFQAELRQQWRHKDWQTAYLQGLILCAFPLEKPVLTHAIGLAVQDHDPALPALEALKEAIGASL